MHLTITETIAALSFYGLAFFAVAAALIVISARNVMVSALWLVVCFIAVAGIYVLLKAPFLAMVQVLVYAGAIMVLFVMLIMLMDIGKFEAGGKLQFAVRAGGAVVSVVIMFGLVTLDSITRRGAWTSWADALTGTTDKIGEALFTVYLLPFEVLSLLLVAAVVAALYLARRPEEKE
jgi:NADH-quinone oxidoreductase subunit J